jgi:hypothetical protein
MAHAERGGSTAVIIYSIFENTAASHIPAGAKVEISGSVD